jgi:DNA-binding transcriptional LysR family regulator
MVEWLRNVDWISYSQELPIIRRFFRVAFGVRIEINPKWIIPDLRLIRDAIALGFGFSVLPDYLCQEWVDSQRLNLIYQPIKPVTNQIWLAFRKRDRTSQKVKMLLDMFC